MRVYKCIPNYFKQIKSGDPEEKATDVLQDILNEQAKEIWIFYQATSFGINEKPGCIEGLFGKKEIGFRRDVLIFYKE